MPEANHQQNELKFKGIELIVICIFLLLLYLRRYYQYYLYHFICIYVHIYIYMFIYISFIIAVAGQGVFVFGPQPSVVLKEVDFSIHPENDQNNGWLQILWDQIFTCKLQLPDEEIIILEDNTVSLSDIPGAYYWFSLDTHNLRLYAGIGEARIETNLFKRGDLNRVKDDKKLKGFLRTLSVIKYNEQLIIPMNISLFLLRCLRSLLR